MRQREHKTGLFESVICQTTDSDTLIWLCTYLQIDAPQHRRLWSQGIREVNTVKSNWATRLWTLIRIIWCFLHNGLELVEPKDVIGRIFAFGDTLTHVSVSGFDGEQDEVYLLVEN